MTAVPALTVLLTGCATASGGDASPVTTGTARAALSRSDSTITTLDISAVRGSRTTDVPVSFGQVFAPGDVPWGFTVAARLNGAETITLQVDAKARHADGSLRHAILSSIIPRLRRGTQLALDRVPDRTDAREQAPGDLASPPGYDVEIRLDIDNATFSASLSDATPAEGTWLDGDLVLERTFTGALRDAGGRAHPLLTARFQVRVYVTGDVRTDAIVENTRAFAAGAANVSYVAEIVAGNEVVMPATAVDHHHHARWRKTVWNNEPVEVRTRHDLAYLVATGAVPNLDRSIGADPATLAGFGKAWKNRVGIRSGLAANALMGAGLADEYMPKTGGRDDIGILPAWTALHLMTADSRAEQATLGTADAAAHWPIHYRDAATGLPLSLEEYPGTTTHPNVFAAASNPLPECVDCDTAMVPDTAHQPSMVFIPYVLTGDHYYLEEMHFWANWNSFQTNPARRGHGAALYRWQQVRGQAWSLRTLMQAVYITPDRHPLKEYFGQQLINNFDDYQSRYVDNPAANKLGWIRAGWTNPRLKNVIVSPWQDDFFTAVLNYGRHLGFGEVLPLLEWKIRFAMNRMTDPVYCWQFATVYHLVASEPGRGALFESMAEAWLPTLQDQFPDRWENISKQECGTAAISRAAGLGSKGDFAGYPTHPVGYPAALRPVLAAALELGVKGARPAWQRLLEAPRQPKYGQHPGFAINPRPARTNSKVDASQP